MAQIHSKQLEFKFLKETFGKYELQTELNKY